MKKYNARIIVPRSEINFIESPEIYLRTFFMNALPPLLDKARFMVAKPSLADDFIEEGLFTVNGFDIEIFSLPGHSPGQIGVGVDDVFFIADSLFVSHIRKKYPIIYYVDVEKTLVSLEKVLNSKYKIFVPSHGYVLEKDDLKAEVSGFREKINSLHELILSLLEKHKEILIDDLVSEVLTILNVEETPEQYYLSKTSINAHVYYLYFQGLINVGIKRHKMFLSVP